MWLEACQGEVEVDGPCSVDNERRGGSHLLRDVDLSSDHGAMSVARTCIHYIY